MKKPYVHGIHHITAFSGDINQNLEFYTNVLGLRLVKKSVNQDAPDVYHLFFADAHGNPGTDLTFFPFPNVSKMRDGYGLVSETGFAIPASSYSFWLSRLEEYRVDDLSEHTRFDQRVITFSDPHGLKLSFTAIKEEKDVAIWDRSSVPAEHQLRGFHTVRLKLQTAEPTLALLTEIMGFRVLDSDGLWTRLESGDGGSGTFVEVAEFPDEPQGRWGLGGVHHVAWRVKDVETELALRKRIAEVGLQPSPKIDRFWFESVYFQEPNGTVFELATDGPGFDRDEDMDKLGETLILPPWLEGNRKEIEKALPKITVKLP
ncbi:MAG: ring-cleaving dioxygenase [Bacteroidetes bacterium]|nr:ring-cleaving dioxygenase [Bacteroidota bacterium]MCH8523440.1 ring-cleaving dioxygenase [Balneolales bacterium]